MSVVPRPRGVAFALVLWACGVVLFAVLTVQGYGSTGHVLPVPASVTVVCAVVAVLVAKGSKWGLLLQVLVLLPSLLLFPFTFVAIMLLGYLTRPETVSYFEQRVGGPRWDVVESWSKGEWPWLVGLVVATVLCVVFSGVLLGLLRSRPNM